MNVQYLSPDSIQTRHSKYRFMTDPEWYPQTPYLRLLDQSFTSIGIQAPLLVHRLADESLHLVDGFKRAAYAKENNLQDLPCTVLTDLPLTSVLDLILADRFGQVDRAPATRIRFVVFALSLGAPREVVIERYLPLLQFEGHENVLQRCEKVGTLPDVVLRFLEDKRFSLKQCVHITRHPPDLLEQLFLWKKDLSLTASVIEELLDNIKDILRARDLALPDLVANEDLQKILCSPSLNQNEKTAALRRLIKAMRYPILTTVNNRIEKLVDDLHFPPTIAVRWDPSLEKKELRVTLTVSHLDMWSDAVHNLTKDTVEARLDALLDEL